MTEATAERTMRLIDWKAKVAEKDVGWMGVDGVPVPQRTP